MASDIRFFGSAAERHIGQRRLDQAPWRPSFNAPTVAQGLRCREVMFVEFDQAGDVSQEFCGQFLFAKDTGRHG